MNGEKVTTYLRDLCQQLDRNLELKALKRTAAIMVIPAAALLPACIENTMTLYGAPDYGAPFEDERCNNGYDDDGDGLADCADDECATLELCLGCFDGIDNDGDGRSDCGDPTCDATEGCLAVSGCSDDTDNDGDGLIDCADPNCAGSDACP